MKSTSLQNLHTCGSFSLPCCRCAGYSLPFLACVVSLSHHIRDFPSVFRSASGLWKPVLLIYKVYLSKYVEEENQGAQANLDSPWKQSLILSR